MISSGGFSNATVRADIQRDYRELRDLLCIAKDCLGISTDRPAYPPRQIAVTLRQLQHRLAVHFTLEEAFGYGEEERLRAPWLLQMAAELRSEHDHIFARLKTIVKSADQLLEPEPSFSVEEISAMFEDFTVDLRRHEDRDAELLLSIFDDDLGVGD